MTERTPEQYVERGEEPEVHDLKTWPVFYEALLDGTKTFEARVDDRNFCEGDILHLREWDDESEEYTGREMLRRVTYLMNAEEWVAPGVVIMGLGSASDFDRRSSTTEPREASTGPYGCLCPTLAIKLNGDGCYICQPEASPEPVTDGEDADALLHIADDIFRLAASKDADWASASIVTLREIAARLRARETPPEAVGYVSTDELHDLRSGAASQIRLHAEPATHGDLHYEVPVALAALPEDGGGES